MSKRWRAIDLYSGIGGWTLGLRMAGIDVVASYERWDEANLTNLKNNRHRAEAINVRNLQLSSLPKDIDVVVGSPPCTEFSLSNRGGNGDLHDGLEDIKKFLLIVQHVRPKFWALENVPRLAPILLNELRRGGRLSRFSDMDIFYAPIDMEEFGLPQRRRRCIIGNFDFDLLRSYASQPIDAPSLRSVIDALGGCLATDPNYGLKVERDALTDNYREDFLNDEEYRINQALKQRHHIYNRMRFPDRLDDTARTVVATCTRVCRESIIVSNDASQTARRLSLRERATLQGFPITFQFFGSTYEKRLKMIGNAMPPLMAYFIAHAMQGHRKAKPLRVAVKAFHAPTELPSSVLPRKAQFRFRPDRAFRFAIPSLHFKSGMRFELRNCFTKRDVRWELAFVYGPSKSFKEYVMHASALRKIISAAPKVKARQLDRNLNELREWIRCADIARMQDVWTHRAPGGLRPFMLLDHLDGVARRLSAQIQEMDFPHDVIIRLLQSQGGTNVSLAKLRLYSAEIAAGILLSIVANSELRAHKGRSRAKGRMTRTSRRSKTLPLAV